MRREASAVGGQGWPAGGWGPSSDPGSSTEDRGPKTDPSHPLTEFCRAHALSYRDPLHSHLHRVGSVAPMGDNSAAADGGQTHPGASSGRPAPRR